MNRLVILPQAKLNLEEIVDWYESQQQGLGKRFIKEFRLKVEKIKLNPEAYPNLMQNAKGALLDKFPYWIFFKELTQKEEILIIAVLSCFRDPAKIEKRLG